MTRTIFGKIKTLKVALPIACLLVAATAWSQVAPGSADVAYNIGFDHVGAGSNFATQSGSGFSTGFNGGYNINQYIEAGGEFNFDNDPQTGFSQHIVNYGPFARFNLAPNSKVVPYGLFAFGGSRATASQSGVSISENGYYLGFGGGASIYLGSNWGVRADLRDNYDHFSFQGSTNSTNAVAFTGGVFFQFGGNSAHKK